MKLLSLLLFFMFFPPAGHRSGGPAIDKARNSPPGDLVPLAYRNSDEVSDLGVGLWAWPLPMDYDGDGDMDLLVSCPDVPYNGLYFFENKSGRKVPVFEAPVRIGPGLKHPQVSYVNGKPRVLDQGAELAGFPDKKDTQRQPLFSPDSLHSDFKKKPRFVQWKYVDYDADGDQDLIAGIDDWLEYGWDNAFDSKGNWTNGPLHGYVYLIENRDGKYENKGRLKAGGAVIDVYGAPSPNFADFDRDGDLDLICGEFVDKFTWFENTGTAKAPVYAAGKTLSNGTGNIRMDLEMIIPVAVIGTVTGISIW
nr:VCBS repeat-containing protein [uncultured Dyadobacter sp.]